MHGTCSSRIDAGNGVDGHQKIKKKVATKLTQEINLWNVLVRWNSHYLGWRMTNCDAAAAV